MRFKGIDSAHFATCSGGNTSVISVLIKPGQTTFARILREPSSFAIDLVKPMIPAFEAA
ncbi:hypothetical protein D3C79_957200 [compost metagenome]